MSKRWNGWGAQEIHYPLPPGASEYLRQTLGPGDTPQDRSYQEALELVPPSRLRPNPSISTLAEDRLIHACGQSLPDWIALRCGGIQAYPDGVAFPKGPDEVRDLLRLAARVGASVIPYGGGTSVVGHINPHPDHAPSLTLDMRNLNALIELDPASRMATIGAGASGPEIETTLGGAGLRLGHFPQSWEHSTLGGWIATRSCGQQSLGYGRIEDLFQGGHVETPLGPIDLQPVPASAAGPDLKELFLGSEGRYGVLTSATVRVHRLPEHELFSGAFFPNWNSGVTALREIAQAGLAVSMLRLSDPLETEVTLQLADLGDRLAWLERGLNLIGLGPDRCLLVYGLSGDQANVRRTHRVLRAILRAHHGSLSSRRIGRQWRNNRFRGAYLRNTLWEFGYAVDTLETAVSWSDLEKAREAILQAIRSGFDWPERQVLVISHLSHVYPTGASLYVTYLFPRSKDRELLLGLWRRMKVAASQAIRSAGGTISHQHGIGTDHKAYLPSEKGDLGIALIKAASSTLDPEGMMNPGKLIPDPDQRGTS